MLTPSRAEELARRWIAAWNSRDLEHVLTLYDDDAEMVSPVIIRLGINENGRLKGKDRLRAYWSTALQGHPDLRFKLLDVFASPDSVVVRYENQRGKVICEFLRFGSDSRIVQGSANHLVDETVAR
jgi:ketosteroid isomerase-like protein